MIKYKKSKKQKWRKLMKYIKNFFEQFIILIQFMTRIPIPIKVDYSEKKLGKSIKFFPLVGLIIGLILYCTNFLIATYLKNILYSKTIIAVILIIVEIMTVGIIHIDGLGDTFDGLFSYAKKERMLEIMKDSRIGTNGAVADYARKSGMSNAIISENGIFEVIFSLVLTNILVFFIIGSKGTVTVFVALLFIILFMLNVRKKIGGITGDTMGASLELTSILVLFLGIILR